MKEFGVSTVTDSDIDATVAPMTEVALNNKDASRTKDQLKPILKKFLEKCKTKFPESEIDQMADILAICGRGIDRGVKKTEAAHGQSLRIQVSGP